MTNSAIDQLRTYARLRVGLGTLIQEARQEGHTWEAIAAALNMSRAGAIKASQKHARHTA